MTGGIGSGKSTVSALLAERGAVIIDADAITRELQQPGGTVFDEIVARFGDAIVAADGTLDRPALAAIVFADEQAKKDLEHLVHPAVGAEMLKRLQAEADTDHVVVYDVPLLVEAARRSMSFAGVIVVDIDPEVAVRRVVEQRGMEERDVRARIASQASRSERNEVADRLIDNSGTRDDLTRQVDEVWSWILTLPQQ
ncbi:MAG TPA: dephospho-CoA kinase [Acidimicrobiales bacterium]|nr:dephospho-CoA kinase [Acidimicrobiales bacterium]